MRKILLLLVASVASIAFLFLPKSIVVAPDPANPVVIQQDPTNKVVAYLQSKQSPLSTEEVGLLVKQEHWKLLVALMGIESQFCRRQLGYNCFGVGGDSAYRHYNNFSEAIVDADALISRWQKRGRWLTVSDMNGHYVQPYNENWERVVNKILNDIKDF